MQFWEGRRKRESDKEAAEGSGAELEEYCCELPLGRAVSQEV